MGNFANIRDPELVARLKAALVAGFRRLESLPITDAFWASRNRAATETALADYVRTLPADDLEAIWADMALALSFCSNDFGCPGWRRLHQLGQLEPRWVVAAAEHVWSATGVPTDESLAQFFKSEGLVNEGAEALRAYRALAFSAQWVEAVLRLLGCQA